MGLDGVELVLSLEEGFGVTISDDEAVEMATPGMVVDLIFSKLQHADEAVCQSQRAFHLLRRGLLQVTGLNRRDVALASPIGRFIPAGRERDMWGPLKHAVQARTWPELVRPRWLSWSLAVAALGILAATAVSLKQGLPHLGLVLPIVFGIAAAIAFGLLAAKATRRFRVRVPYWLKRVRDLVPLAVTSDRIGWTRTQIAGLVKKIVIDQLGLPEDKYREDARFVEELGMG